MSSAAGKLAPEPRRRGRRDVLVEAWLLWLGVAMLAAPTMVTLAREYWSLEQGGHGPIVLATGLWLMLRERHAIVAMARPGSPLLTGLLLVPSLLAYVFARMTGMLGIECLGMYGAFLAILYYHVGWPAIRALRFPLIYLLFMFPEPETLTLPLSHALKLFLSSAAVALLSALGYHVGHGGVVLYVDQYELLIATACSGLQSLIGLTSVGVFYCYVRYAGSWRASLPLLLLLPPIAMVANFIRVLILILITHYFGDRVAQVYVHGAAAVLLFFIAVMMMVGADHLLGRRRRARRA